MEFKKGDVVKLSRKWLDHNYAQYPDRIGIIKGFSIKYNRVSVLWDGRKSIEWIHENYVELTNKKLNKIPEQFLIGGIDWIEFKQQKLAVIRATSNEHIDDKDKECFEGLLNLMDHIQDQANDWQNRKEIYLSKKELDKDNIDHGITPDPNEGTDDEGPDSLLRSYQ